MTAKQQNLVVNNMNMVYEITKPYKCLRNYEDIVSEGMVGLCNAATKFDEIRGNNFSTFAYMHILGRCLNFINRDKIVRPKRTGGKYESITSVTLSCELENTYAGLLEFDNSEAEETLLLNFLSQKLDDKEFRIVFMLYSGYRRNEITQYLNISQQQLHTEIEKLRKKLNDLDIRSNNGTSKEER